MRSWIRGCGVLADGQRVRAAAFVEEPGRISTENGSHLDAGLDGGGSG